MKKLTIEELEMDFDSILEKVEEGQSFLITSENGNAVLIPYDDYYESDEIIRIHTDHDEGS
jgi:prevent-host-death family protein